MRTILHYLFFLWVLGCVVACAPSITPRTADVAAPGEARIQVHATHIGYAHGEATVREPEFDSAREVTNNAASALPIDTTTTLLRSLSVEAGMWFGIVERCELGGIFAFGLLAAEARCALTAPDAPSPLRLAVGGVGGYTYLFRRSGVMARTSLDASWHTPTVTPFLNLGLQNSRNAWSMVLSEEFESPGRGLLRPTARVAARATTLNAALGVQWRAQEIGRVTDGGFTRQPGRFALFVALSPQLVLNESSNRSVRCQNCTGLQIEEIERDWAVYLTVGAVFHDIRLR